MRKLLLAVLLASPLGAQQAPSTFDFSIKNIMRGPELYGRVPQDVRWSADSKWIYFNWVEPGTDWRETPKRYRVRAVAGSKPERVTPAQFDSAGATATRGDRSGNGRYLAVEYGGDIYVTDMVRGTTRRLTQTNARESEPVFSTDASKVFFIRENNVYSINLNDGLLQQLTDLRAGPAPKDSSPPTGQAGRIAQQQRDLFEVIRDKIRADSIAKAARDERASRALKIFYTQAGEQLASVTASPSGDALLLTTNIPARGQRSNDIPRYITESGYVEQIHGRENVGDVQDKGRVAHINLRTGNLTWLKPYATDTTAGFAIPLGWSNDGKYGAYFGFTADNKMRVLQVVDASGKQTTLSSERDSAWIGGPCSYGCAGWYDDGRRFFWVSEESGYAHLYTIAANGTDKRQLTSGKWEVLDVDLSADGKTFYLRTNEPSPAEEQFYTMSVNGGPRTKVTAKSGRHVVTVSPDGSLLADVYSYVNRPPDLFLMQNKPGAEESQLTLSPSKEWLSFNWIAPKIVMVPASDGAMVPAHIYTPQDMGAQPNGAAVIFVHGAGYLHNVGNFWSEYPREYMFNQYLASKGYVVMDADYRASSGYGRDWRTAIYRYMGGRDLQDQVDVSKYLTKTYNIDPDRIGIYGGSYGGFITEFALFTQAQYFGAGAAIRSVTDWAHYNHGYTSNILNTPQLDTLAFRRSSPIYFAEGLKDPLLILHGMVDVNVLVQDDIRLSQRLIELGKENWQMMLYPVEDHAFVRPSSWTDEYKRIFKIFEDNLPSRVPVKPDTP
ncbi:MAG TPA: prolyl oligopeptidase family serine peptidase [Gemmatimonadaceae bacterium]|nr:prolyl oligopeptidase family serine peptidase [Gemmatimonadaceae bacterium]